jgi:hypothetical protein
LKKLLTVLLCFYAIPLFAQQKIDNGDGSNVYSFDDVKGKKVTLIKQDAYDYQAKTHQEFVSGRSENFVAGKYFQFQITNSSVVIVDDRFTFPPTNQFAQCVLFLNHKNQILLNGFRQCNIDIDADAGSDMYAYSKKLTSSGNVRITNTDMISINFNVTLDQLTLDSCNDDTIRLDNHRIIQQLIFFNSVIGKNTSFYNFWPPKILTFDHVDFNAGDEIDLTRLSDTNTVCLQLRKVDFTKLKIPLDRFEFMILQDNYERMSILYQQLLKSLKDAGLTEKYARYDEQFQQLQLLNEGHPLINAVAKWWWNYGYDKGKVVKNSFLLFGIFFVLNLLFNKYFLWFISRRILKLIMKIILSKIHAGTLKF